MTTRLLACALALLAAAPARATDPPPGPVQVFVLAGQSNMEGHAVVDLTGKDYNGGKGTLAALLADPAKAKLIKHLKAADGKWAVRDDVWVRYQREGRPLLAGRLGIGFSVYGDAHHFGPELQFGHVVGDHLPGPVLLIKAAWGGKSLYKDFRPPSSGAPSAPTTRSCSTRCGPAWPTSRPTSRPSPAARRGSPGSSGTRGGTTAWTRRPPCPSTSRTS